MIDQANASGKLALDGKGLDELRRIARQHSPEALTLVARQFEALLINMMLRSMRDATLSSDLMNGEQGRLYTSLMDQQLSQSLASKGVGLADVLTRQLNTLLGSESGTIPAAEQHSPLSLDGPGLRDVSNARDPRAFLSQIAAHAEDASRATGIPAQFMIGHAALETGWGHREIIGADGSNSHNLFGIKATNSWKGRVVESVTHEYVDGVAKKVIAKFRAYDSYAEAFMDYAKLLQSNPRYKHVMENRQDPAAFAEGLQRGGYATDPAYADKLTRVIKQIVTS